MDIIKISKEIRDTSVRLRNGVDALQRLAKEYAKAEQKYRLALAREIIILRDDGLPATLVADVARGNVSDLKYKRDLAEVSYKTGRDMLRGLQSELSGWQTLYNKQEEI